MGLGASRRRFLDPGGEVGVGLDDERTSGVDVYLSPRLRVPLWRGAFLGVVGEQRTEHVDVDERGAADPMGDSQRLRIGWGAGIELEQKLWRLLVVPALRVDAVDSRFAVPAGAGAQSDAGTDARAVGVTPRGAARLTVTKWLDLRASAGRYFRPPTLVELFGDRGYFVGNEGLRPERGTSVDGGAVVDVAAARLDVYAQLVGFWTRSRDLVQWVSAGSVARPENVATARLRGLEAALVVAPRSRRIALQTNYTLLEAIDLGDDPTRHGRPLPGRPRHELFARASVGWPTAIRGVALEPRLFSTVDLVAGTRLDPSDRYRLPPRALQGIGAELHVAERVHLAVELRNLLDVRTAAVVFAGTGGRAWPVAVSDFIGWPLPGRSVWATLRIDMDPRRKGTT
jgi:iron complex outermembrane receptor protein